jgi:hypothetical protein
MASLKNDICGDAGYDQEYQNPAQRVTLLWTSIAGSAVLIRHAMPRFGERPASLVR